MGKSLVHVVTHNMRKQKELQLGISTHLMQSKEILFKINNQY
jgi:hypothetical protein